MLQHVQPFKASLLLEQGLAEATITAYVGDILDFIRYIDRTSAQDNPTKINRFDILDYLECMQRAQKAANTITAG